MSYGVNILGEQGQSNISGLVTNFVLEILYPTSAGNKTYTISPNESLKAAVFFSSGGLPSTKTITNVKASGNTVSWTIEDLGSASGVRSIGGILVTKEVT